LVGWAMLSAAPYPIVLGGGLHLPPILPQDPVTYTWLRRAHTCLAYALFATIVVHFGAALLHGLIRRDGVLESMASGAARRPATERVDKTVAAPVIAANSPGANPAE